MRRKDREITDKTELLEILKISDTCRIAFNTENAPYIVPLNYGYRWDDRLEIYIHCAQEGRKINLLRADPYVGFEIDTDHFPVKGEKPCQWGMSYKSIIGTGKITVIQETAQKKAGLDHIMTHYGFSGTESYDEKVLEKTMVLKLEVIELSGKVKK